MFLNCVLSACPLLQRNVHFFSENSVTDHIFLVHRRAELLILAKQSTIAER